MKKKLKKTKLAESVQAPLKKAGELSSKGVGKLTGRDTRSTEDKFTEALSSVPRITNENVTEHREEVLRGARKYIYPLQHSKRRVVRTSITLLLAALVAFLLIVVLSLYKFQSTSAFAYDVTRIIPFPVAKAGKSWVSYESYLFELRRNMHYYQVQQQADFHSKEGRQQLQRLKRQAMDQVVRDAYVKQLAAQHKVKVSDQAVDNQVQLLRDEKRLGNSQRVFREVLNEFWGWDETDFRRELHQQLLQQAVVAKLDSATNQRAANALNQLKSGTDFAKLAAAVSDDPVTKGNGGAYPNPITVNDRDVPPVLTAEIFKLKAGQTSEIINSGYSLDIIRVTEATATTRKALHLQFNFKDINSYVKPLRDHQTAHQYIRF